MQKLKSIIGKTAGYFGYSIRKTSNPFQDLQKYFDPKSQIIALDVGAHHGKFSLSLIKRFLKAKIFAFEPESSDFFILVKNVNKYENIIPQKLAICDHNGPVTLFKTKMSHSSSLLQSKEIYFDEQKTIGTETVEGIRLNVWLERNSLDKVNILKLDTQGLDLRILRDNREILPKIESVFVETNFKPQYFDSANFIDLNNFLDQNNYNLVNLYNFINLKGIIISCDGLYVRRDLSS